MRKLLVVFLCALLFTLPCVHAEQPPVTFPTPAPESTQEPAQAPSFQLPAAGDGLNLTIDDIEIKLDFDSDPQYSSCSNGYVQASFFAYDESDVLYELFMVFPDTVTSGSSVTSESCIKAGDEESGLMLFVGDACSMATQFKDSAFPSGCSYEIRFSEIRKNGADWTFTGTVEGSLIVIDENYNPLSETDEISGEFRFTMSMDGSAPAPSATPDSSAAPDAPAVPMPDATPEPYAAVVPTPAAHLVTPANAKKI